jgi:Rhodopirellula transposase DDE domain
VCRSSAYEMLRLTPTYDGHRGGHRPPSTTYSPCWQRPQRPVVVNTIASARTRVGLRVEAELDTGIYPLGVSVSRTHPDTLPIQRHYRGQKKPWMTPVLKLRVSPVWQSRNEMRA